jgi:hypothetical protein
LFQTPSLSYIPVASVRPSIPAGRSAN